MSKERGFILLSVIFLTLITSFMAMMVFNANLQVQQHNSNLRFVAMYLADEQFAEIESLAAKGDLSADYDFLGDDDDLTVDIESNPVKFSVSTNISGDDELKNVNVIVSWIVDNEENSVEFEKFILVNH